MNNMRLICFQILLATILFAASCAGKNSGFSNKKISFPELNVAYTMYGPVSGYKIEMTKPKVVTYCWGVRNLNRLLSETPHLKINSIIEQNPKIEFVFYLDGINHADMEGISATLSKYAVTYPIILDFESTFALANTNIGTRLRGPNEEGITIIGFFCDGSNRIFKNGSGVIGTDKSKMFFDPGFARFKAALR